jgi:hypothetical protein
VELLETQGGDFTIDETDEGLKGLYLPSSQVK